MDHFRQTDSGPAARLPEGARRIGQWLRARDAELSAVRRTGRAAIVLPGLFALAQLVIGSSVMAVFSAFGSLALLLFVDFGGPMRQRLVAQGALALTGAAGVCLGTLVSRTVWLAAAAMFVVAFVVLFTSVVSSVLAGAQTSLLASFILPATLLAPVSALPERLAGWLLAGAVSVAAIGLLWPAPVREPLRRSAARACALLADRLRAEVDRVGCGFDRTRSSTMDNMIEDSGAAVAALRTEFFRAPYRPTGFSTVARTLVRLTDEIVWLDAILEHTPAGQRTGPTTTAVCEVKLAGATLLERGAALLESGLASGLASGAEPRLDHDLDRLRAARETMERTVTSALPVRRSPDGTTEFVSSLEPSFRAQEMTFAISAIAENIELAVTARRRSWWRQLLGSVPGHAVSSPSVSLSLPSSLLSAREWAGAQAERHSVWLHNSVRGATALGLAVLVAGLTGVDHSFWVVFGALAVLRSNALSTGQSAVRALAGTVVGIVIGCGLIFVIGTNSTVFWLLLPAAVACTGLAPAIISFAAGQAGFTIVLLILFSIIQPTGLTIGLVRIEDVAIGCAVSLVVGALFWPRGAAPALRAAVAAALSESARYLRGAVEYGVSRCDAKTPAVTTPREEHRRAGAAARRLDDAFRGFLTERGTKHIALAEVTSLITAVAALRLTASAVLDLWRGDGAAPTGDRTTARAEVLAAGTRLVGWYEQTARALAGTGTVPEPLRHDRAADGRLIDAVRRDLDGQDAPSTTTAVKMIWTADHLDAARRLQATLSGPAKAAAAEHHPRLRPDHRTPPA
ncbi:MAG TPA: FUSC family protein [Amycolatopsis sp.]|nr:FUSC family protein [Amycolatopsis sp.]